MPCAIPEAARGEYRTSHVECETVLREGSDVTVVCYGTMVNNALECARILEKRGVSAEVIKLGIIKPNELRDYARLAQKDGAAHRPGGELCSRLHGRAHIGALR